MATNPVSLPGESQGQRSLVGYSPWGHKESDTTEWLTLLSWEKNPNIFWKWKSESASHPVVSDSLRLHGLYSPWNSVGQNTGVDSLSPSPGDLPNPGSKHRSPTLQDDSLPAEPQGKPKSTGVDSLSHLQRIFPNQDSNQGLRHCRQILYQLSNNTFRESAKINTPPKFQQKI